MQQLFDLNYQTPPSVSMSLNPHGSKHACKRAWTCAERVILSQPTCGWLAQDDVTLEGFTGAEPPTCASGRSALTLSAMLPCGLVGLPPQDKSRV